MRGWSVWCAAVLVTALGAGCSGGGDTGTTITVNGVVKTYQGQGIDGYWAVVVDADGKRSETRTGEDGGFQFLEVKPPYSVSAIPLGPLQSNKTAITFDGITRVDPTLVIHDSGRAPACTTIEKVAVMGSLASPVPVGHKARVMWMSRGIAAVYLLGYVNVELAEGDSNYQLTVPFRSPPCYEEMDADVVYLEFDGAGKLVRSAHRTAKLLGTQDSASVSMPGAEASTGTVSGRILFPEGVETLTVRLNLKVGENYGRFEEITLTPEANTFSFTVPRRPGFEMVVEATNGNNFAFSRPVQPGAIVELTVPAHPARVAPVGMADSSTPTFVREARAGANAYMTLVRKNGANIWVGFSSTPEITMPALPEQAALDSTAEHNWVDFYAFELAPGLTFDDLLDGRLVRERSYIDWRTAAELVSSGTRNTNSTVFYVP